MPRKSEPRLFVARETGQVRDPDEGVPITLIAGHTIVDEGDPVYQANKHMFGPAQSRRYRRIEQMTAAPGERRGG